jgi:cell shape-determining protein MreC
MAGVKALDKRTREMKTAVAVLMEANQKLKEQLAGLKDLSEQVAALRLMNAKMQEQLDVIKAKDGVAVSVK